MKTFNQQESNVLEEIIFHRRDVRGNRFQNQPIPDEKMEKILWAGIHAPSVGYSQPWEFIVVKASETKKAIRQIFDRSNQEGSGSFEGERKQQYDQMKLEGIIESPVNVAVYYRSSETPVLGQTAMPDMGKYSVVCAIQNMWLMARSLNIGMGWVSILDPKEVSKVLQVPASHELIGYLCFGYVDLFYDQPELERKKWDTRKQLEAVTHYERYRHD